MGHDDFSDEKVTTNANILVADIKEDTVLAPSTSTTDGKWLLDTGVTCGVTYDKEKMSDMRSLDLQITIGNGAQIPTLGQGIVTLGDQTLVTLDINIAHRILNHPDM